MSSSVLSKHLEDWLGLWPPPGPFSVVESELRQRPGWDGAIRPLAGITSPDGTVLSVPVGTASSIRRRGSTLTAVGPHLGPILNRPDSRLGIGVFRWSDSPSPNDDPGIWLPTDDGRLPAWLTPFNGDVLVGFEGQAVACGVGRKQHNRWGHELAVVTEQAFRGRGWANRLVAQAGRRVIADGAIPTYLHDPANSASARTADAAGFPDRGWRIIGLW